MAATQVKPTSGGSWQNTGATAAKSTTGISNLSPYAQQQVMHAANLYTWVGGAAGAHKTAADKMAAAVSRSLQWA